MKKIIIPISTLFVVGLSHAQTLNLSTNENYVYTKTYLTDPTASTPKSVETVQYFDGLGRPKQVVNIKASPLQRDVVTHIEYDAFGRQVKDFLPVPQSGTANGAIVTNPLANATQTDIYGSEIIFSKKEFENSPLDRVLEQKQVGNAWNDKPIKFDYDANADGEVKKYVATFNYSNFESSISLSTSGYGANQLYKNTVTDEDGNKTIEFKNGRGQTILVRKMLDAFTEADTYYVYNDYNQLAYVIPPLAVTANTVDETTLNNLCYQYKYDGRNRLVEKKLPGKGWEYMVYDKADRLVATQDAVMSPSHKWLFTKYDKFGRVLYTGISIDNGDRNAVQTWITNTYGINTEVSGSYTQSGMQIPYGNTAYPQNIESILSVNYYDTYPTGTPAIPTQILGQNVLPQDAQNSNISTKSLPVASYVKNIEDDNWTKNYTWYDTKGRAIGSHSVNHLGGYTKTESELDFSGTSKMMVTRHKRLATDIERVITENFTYDHQNRLLTHTHQVDNNPVEYLAQNEYNELSQLKNKKVGGASLGSGLQQVDYAYNIRGWMTQINNPNDLSGGDLFGYKIRYNEREGLETPDALDETLQVKPKFNGNIAEVDWRTGTNPNENLRRYGYVYDGLNRLKAGFYQNEVNPSATEYYEKLTYDLNGNIINMKRTASKGGNTVASLIDNLNYNYSVTGNRLTSITDVSTDYRGYPGGGGTITYDLNGNMKMHPDKGISSINYNYLNLPNEMVVNSTMVFFNNYVLKYQYRADGVKLRKKQLKNQMDVGGGWETVEYMTDYLDGFQYSQNIVFGYPQAIQLQFVPTSEGYFDYVKNKYIYNYSDHLGNTRLSYFHNGSSIEVLEENNYYPFGLKHEGYNALAGNPSYQYKYNGKELQETGMYDYGARFYMPDLGRWGVVDPLAETNRRFTPYNYAINNPIRFIDPDGRSESDWVRKDGKWQYDAKITTLEQAQHTSGVDGFAKNGTILSNVSVDGGAESAYAQLNEGGSITKLGSDEVNISSIPDMLSYRTWEPQEFQSFLGGANETDPSTASKAIFGDKLTSNDMFQQIFMFYGRNTRLNRKSLGDAAIQFGLDVEGIGNPLGGSSGSPSGVSSGSPDGTASIKSDTFSYHGSQAVGLNIYKGSGGITTGVGVKTQDVYKTNMTRAQRDSMINRVNADGAKFKNKSDSILRRIQSR